MNAPSCVMSIERVIIQQKQIYFFNKFNNKTHAIVTLEQCNRTAVLQGYGVGRPMTQPSRRHRYDAQS